MIHLIYGEVTNVHRVKSLQKFRFFYVLDRKRTTIGECRLIFKLELPHFKLELPRFNELLRYPPQ